MIMQFIVTDIIDLINTIDLPVLLGLFGFVGSVIIWGFIKNR
jgi:hypothetical protein